MPIVLRSSNNILLAKFAPRTECDANREPDGTCAEGALEPDCCECDTIGNATHAFYKNENDECIRKHSNYYLDI